MDERVTQAMARWPDVPAAYGWLRLDRRGRWHLIDRNTPGFNEAEHGQGSPLKNENLVDFIARNYMVDETGCWYWQNGPQKAYADLDAAPLIVRVMQQAENQDATASNLVTHTGYPITTVSRVCAGLDDVLYLSTDLGPASIHDMDLASLEIREASDSQVRGDHFDGQNQVYLLDNWYEIDTLVEPAESVLGFTRQPRGA